MALLARLGIEDVAPALGHVGRSVQMEGHGEVAALVRDAVDAQLVGHVCHFVFLVHPLRDDPHGLLSLARGEGVSRLCQVAAEDLHQAVRLAMIVDGATLARRPHEDKLFSSVRGKVNKRSRLCLSRVQPTRLLFPFPSSTRFLVYPRLSSPMANLDHSLGSES